MPAATICPPASPPSGPEVDDPVGRLDDLEVVLDDEHGVAGVDEVVQHLQQQLDVGEVQAGGRLVQQVERPAGAPLDQFAGQLDPLGLAAGERGRGLAELHVVQAHVVQRLQLLADGGDVLEMPQRLLDVHFQHLGDRLALEADLQRLAVEAVPLAHRAGDPHVGQEVHLQLVRAVALAGLAAAAADVEAEAARLVAAGLRLGQLRVELADLVEDLDVGGRVASAACGRWATGRWRSSCRDVPGRRCRRWAPGLPMPPLRSRRRASTRMSFTSELLPEPETPVTQTNSAQRDLDVDVLEIVVRGAADDEFASPIGRRGREPRSAAGRRDTAR